jgi:MFS family permease
MIVTHRTREVMPQSSTQSQVLEDSQPTVDFRYIVVAWSLCLTANFVQRPLTTFIPKFYAEAGQPAWMAGALLSVLMFGTAGFALVCRNHPQWLYRRKPLVIMQTLLIVGLGCLWAFPGFGSALLAMTSMGMLFGFLFFSTVYYVSNSARSARNVGVNEAMVGAGNIAGMLCSEWAIRTFAYRLAFYPVLMLFLMLVLIAQMWWLRTPFRQPAFSS